MYKDECSTCNDTNYLVYERGVLIDKHPPISIIYKISSPPSLTDFTSINQPSITNPTLFDNPNDVTDAINTLEKFGYVITLSDIQPTNWKLNLEVIDSCLPEIIGATVYYSLKTSVLNWVNLIGVLNKANPMLYNLSHSRNFYAVKISAFLSEVAMGMKADNVWNGDYNGILGIIIIKGDGQPKKLHISNPKVFQEYLLNNTRLAGNSYGSISEKEGDLFLKVPLTVEFI